MEGLLLHARSGRQVSALPSFSTAELNVLAPLWLSASLLDHPTQRESSGMQGTGGRWVSTADHFGVSPFAVTRRAKDALEIIPNALRSPLQIRVDVLCVWRRMVLEFRRWLDSRGGGGPTPGDPGPLLDDRHALLDRWEQHTKHCPSCLKVRA